MQWLCTKLSKVNGELTTGFSKRAAQMRVMITWPYRRSTSSLARNSVPGVMNAEELTATPYRKCDIRRNPRGHPLAHIRRH